MKTRIMLIAVALLMLVHGCNGIGSGNKLVPVLVPAPELKSNDVFLKVAYVFNPAFPARSTEDINAMLAFTVLVAKEHLGLNITFSKVATLDIKDVFDQIPQKITDHIDPLIIDIHKDNFTRQDKDVYAKLLAETLSENSSTYEEELAFTQDHLDPKYTVRSEKGLVLTLTNTIFSRVKAYKQFLGNNPYNEWLYWQALGYTDLGYDILITNQPIISIETIDTDIHHALRGGISVGSASFNKASEFRARVFWSTFTFFQQHEVIRKLRGGMDYTDEEAIELSGAYLTHELGHMLLHLDHPFGRKECVMTPVPLLDVKTWYEDLDAPSCAIGSSKAMTPGAMKLYMFEKFM